MDNNELNRIADLVWCKLNTIYNQDLNKEEQIKLIKPILTELALDSRNTGRNQILNHIDGELKSLRD